MSSRLIELAERREHLVAKIALQRGELAHHAASWKGVFATVDKGVAGLRYLRQHPGLLVGAAALLLVFRPRRALNWVKWGWPAWRVVKKIRQYFLVAMDRGQESR